MTDYGHSLAYTVKRTQQAIRHAMDKTLADLALTTSQYAALNTLSGETGLSNAELARRCFVTPQTMHQIIGGLESRSLIGRSPHLQHGKIVQVVVTEAGRQLLDKAHRVVGEVQKKMTHDLSAAEEEQATGILLRCCTALEL